MLIDLQEHYEQLINNVDLNKNQFSKIYSINKMYLSLIIQYTPWEVIERLCVGIHDESYNAVCMGAKRL